MGQWNKILVSMTVERGSNWLSIFDPFINYPLRAFRHYAWCRNSAKTDTGTAFMDPVGTQVFRK